MYDLIGDIHGYADELKQLLDQLGYQPRNGFWQHPSRQVIFLGDFVDRGPKQQDVVDTARAMVEGASALAVMGNHEFNAVAWATTHPDKPDEHLRPHTTKNWDQHQKFLAEVGEDSETHREMIEWFKTLPVFLDLPGLRVVHACWHPRELDAIAPYLDAAQRIKPDAWPELNDKQSVGFEAVEVLLKGLEKPLPPGYSFLDEGQHPRHNIRVRWWDLESTAYRDLAMVPDHAMDDLPDGAMPDDDLPGYDGQKPVFFGHYWLKGTPQPLNRHIACLDYSVVDPDQGKLCAYRWDGEKTLSAENMVWIERVK